MVSKDSIRLLKTVAEARDFRLQCTLERKSVGFVPTMGALHAGHCSLVTKSLEENDITIVSIFVNPSQFSPNEDLDAYPRTLDSDLSLLEKLSHGDRVVNAVFLPSVHEMYPNGITLDPKTQKGAFVSVLGVSEQLEGACRPQFFKGVATVVTKLFNVIVPTRAYFGAKDIQQTVVIRRMVQDLLLPIEIKVMPTIREDSGLLLSSRNLYLATDIKQQSAIIYEALHLGELLFQNGITNSSSEILQKVHDILKPFTSGEKNSFNVEYIKINHPKTLVELETIDDHEGAIMSTAIRVPKADGGEARLIDNVILTKQI